MDLGLKSKVIIITGGAGRAGSIGYAISTSVANEGAIPVILDNDNRGEEFAKNLEKSGAKALFIKTDVTRETDVKSAIDIAKSHFGRIDGIVNNVGVNDGVGLDADLEAFERSLRLNLVSAWLVVKHALPFLKVSGGSIVNIASKVAITGQGNTSGYAAAKGGILGLTREWAVDLVSDKIRVNAVLPAEVWTPSYKDWIDSIPNGAEKLNEIERKIPFESRMTTPDEIANSVLFLLSSKASHTTGQWLSVDGGYVHLDRSLLTKI